MLSKSAKSQFIHASIGFLLHNLNSIQRAEVIWGSLYQVSDLWEWKDVRKLIHIHTIHVYVLFNRRPEFFCIMEWRIEKNSAAAAICEMFFRQVFHFSRSINYLLMCSSIYHVFYRFDCTVPLKPHIPVSVFVNPHLFENSWCNSTLSCWGTWTTAVLR